MVGLFKILGGVLSAGATATLFFGTPLWVATGVALGFAAIQSVLAVKICKGDTPMSRKILSISRKIMGERPDGDKERAIAPVWGGVTAALGLAETFINWMFKRDKVPPAEILARLEKAAETPSKTQWFNRIQLGGFRLKELAFKRGMETPFYKRLLERGVIGFMERYKTPLVFAFAGISGMIGGYLQALLAVKLEKTLRHK